MLAFACRPRADGQGFVAEVQGTGPLAGHRYGIDDRGRRWTIAHPAGLPPADCWSVAGARCDFEP